MSSGQGCPRMVFPAPTMLTKGADLREGHIVGAVQKRGTERDGIPDRREYLQMNELRRPAKLLDFAFPLHPVSLKVGSIRVGRLHNVDHKAKFVCTVARPHQRFGRRWLTPCVQRPAAGLVGLPAGTGAGGVGRSWHEM